MENYVRIIKATNLTKGTMNKEYLQWIRHEFYLWKRDIKNNNEPAIFYNASSYLKWLRNYYETNLI